jgi:hypothetical protein
MTEKLNDVNNKLKASKENVIAARTGREPTKERDEVLKKVAELKAEEEALLKEIKEYEMWEKMKKESEVWNTIFKIPFLGPLLLELMKSCSLGLFKQFFQQLRLYSFE